MQTNQQEWKPIEGVGKKKRPCDTKTPFALKRADHRNAILKGWASKLESIIEPKVPTDYVSPFDTGKCIYCETKLTGCPTGDEFRPSTQRGRQNIVNRVPCCGVCHPSKQDKTTLIRLGTRKRRRKKNSTRRPPTRTFWGHMNS